jgi:hypothetical protein
MRLKVLSVERRKNYEHVIGKEFKEKYVAKDERDIRLYIGEYLDNLYGEVYDQHENDIESIYNLKNGFYAIDDGDFTLYVDIQDY